MKKKPRLVLITQVGSREEQEAVSLIARTLRPTNPDQKLARRIKQRLTAEWLARDLVIALFVGIACVGLIFGAGRQSR